MPNRMNKQPTSEEHRDITTRAVSLNGAKTFNADARSVRATISTEAPAKVFDWSAREVIDEVLLMSGVQMPESRQVPLLDDHSRWGSESVIGSARSINIENGVLSADLIFAANDRADGIMALVRDGHLTDVSIGYRVLKCERIPKDEKRMIQGREYAGPMRVATSWELLETSTTPIGADRFAKMRSEPDAAEAQNAQGTGTRQEAQENGLMNEKLRKMLEARGLKVGASEDEAVKFLENLDEAARKSIKTECDTAVEAERKRFADIEELCAAHKMPAEFRSASIKSGKTIDQVRSDVLAELAKPPAPNANPKIQVGKEDKENFRAAAAGAILLRSGMVTDAKTVAEGSAELAGASTIRLAEECLRRAGQGVKMTDRPEDIAKRAMSTSDFPLILADVGHKSLVTAFNLADETWSRWCGTVSVPDKRAYYLNSIGELSDINEVKEGAEYQYMTTAEKRESVQVKTYGGLVAITRDMVINDDLNAFTSLPAAQGRAIARKLGDLAFAVLTANGTMADSVALFYSTHGNLGTAGEISATTLAEAVFKMGAQKDVANKQVLNLTAKFFMSGRKKMPVAEQFFQAVWKDESSKMLPNIYQNYIPLANRIYDSRLDITTDTTIDPWYLQADKGMGVVMAFLNGVQTPYMEQEQEFDRDVLKFKCRIDAAAAAVDHRGLYKNAGH